MEAHCWNSVFLFISLFIFPIPIVTTSVDFIDSIVTDEVEPTTTVTFFADNPEPSAAMIRCENATFLAGELLSAERQLTDILSVKYIAGLIKLGKYKLAQKEFSGLNDGTNKVGKIVAEVYNEKDTKKRYLLGKKVLNFLSNFELDSTCETFPAAILVLHKQMEKYKKSSAETDDQNKYNDIAPEIILTSEQFLTANCSKVSTMFSNVATAEQGINALRILTIRLLEKWKSMIRQQDFDEIRKFCRAPRTLRSLKRFLPEIVRTAYAGNKTHFAAVEKFAQELCNNQLTAVSMATLFNEIRKENDGHTGEMLELGFSIRKFGWNEGKKFDGNRATETLFANLRRGLPQVIGKMIWGNRCTVKNLKTGDYLYAGSDNYTDTFMVAKKEVGNAVVGSGGWWQFHPWKKDGDDNNDKGSLYWLVKNMEWERDKPYLCVRLRNAHGKNKDELEDIYLGQVETCYKTGFRNKKMMMANWMLEPVTTAAGVKDLFQFYTLDKNSRRFDLVLEEDVDRKKKKKVQTPRPSQKQKKQDKENVMPKVVVHEEEDDEREGKSVTDSTDYQLLAKVEGYRLEESYWQIQCE